MSEQPVSRTAAVRVVLKIGATLIAGALALTLILHAPFVRSAALRYVLTTVQRDYGLTLDAARLDYNLATLRVGLATIRLSTPGFGSEPFFEAEYLLVTLPLGALFGDVAFKDITVTNARAFVHRRANGTTNLPRSEDGAGVEPPALRIDRLDVSRLAIELRDEQAASSLQVPALALVLTRDEGSVSLEMPAELRLGTHATRIVQLRGQAVFDGRALRLAGVELRTDEVSATLDGTFLLVTRDPRIDLRLMGTGDIARLARWGLTDEELPQGAMAFEGTVTGPMDDPQAQVELSTERVVWHGATAADLAVRMRVGATGADVQELRAAFADGTVTATGSLPFGSGATGRATVSWTGVNAASATAAVLPEAGLVPSALSSGELDIEGILADASTWSGSLRLQMVPGRNARGRIAVGGDLMLDWRDGTWRLEGRSTLARVAPIQVEARGRFVGGPQAPSQQAGIASSTLECAVRLAETGLPTLLTALRTIGIATITDDAVAAGTLDAEIDLGGSLGDPSVRVRASARGLAVLQFAAESVNARVSGRLFQPRLEFSIETAEGGMAGQRLNDVRAAGLITGTSIVLDELSARQATGPGVVAGRGTYDLNTGEYNVSIDGAEWLLAATADQPLGGSMHVRFAGAGTAKGPSGTGHVTLADATWQDMMLGDLDASVHLDW